MHADAIEGSYRECRFVTDTYGQCLEAVARAVDLVSAVGDAPVESDVGRQIALDAARDDRVTRLLAVGDVEAVPRGEIGSCWRLPVPAWFIEWPRGNTTLTLSAVADGARADLAAGTRLRLVEIDDLADVRGGDLVTWITYYEDWETRTYVVGDGPRAGQRIMFSGNPAGGRFPRSSVLAHSALEPTGEDEPL